MFSKNVLQASKYRPLSKTITSVSRSFPQNKQVLKSWPQCSMTRALATEPFFQAVHQSIGKKGASVISLFLQNKTTLRNMLKRLGVYESGNYLHDHFTYWLSAYASQSPACLQDYLTGKSGLEPVCRDFIHFCFKQNIQMDKDKTLESFRQHNEISDNAVKNELAKIKPKKTINLLGFGLGDGGYEKLLAQHLIAEGIAKEVIIYGFDPYAEETDGVKFLTDQQLSATTTPIFDIVTTRWVLHHVALQHRWNDFIRCVNRCNNDALVLIVEHGFLKNPPSEIDAKLYHFIVAIFDVVANIGIRPQWFTSTAPDFGANFFVKYLEPKDFEAIKNGVSCMTTQSIYEVGPNFPNQTICCMQMQRR